MPINDGLNDSRMEFGAAINLLRKSLESGECRPVCRVRPKRLQFTSARPDILKTF